MLEEGHLRYYDVFISNFVEAQIINLVFIVQNTKGGRILFGPNVSVYIYNKVFL